jgi:chromosome segregation protein
MFDAEAVHAAIIEAAIGELDQYLVLSGGDVFLSHPELFDDLPGRLTAICLDRLPPVINEPVHVDHPSIVANAVDVVRYEEGYGRLARHLLGKTVVVDTLENALALAKADPAERRFVTLKGELVEPNGCVSVGPPGSRAGLIARKSERRKVKEALESIELRIASLTGELEEIDGQSAHLESVCGELRTAIEQANAAKVEAGAGLERVNEAVRRLSEEQPMIAGEVTLIGQQIEEARQRASESAESASRLDEENERREQAVAAYAEEIERLSEERERVQFALTDARVAVGKLAEKRKATADSIGELRRAIRITTEAIEAAAQEHDDAHSRISDSREVIESARRRLEELSVTAERLEGTAIQLRRRREMTQLESEQVATRIKAARSRLEEVESRVHHLELDMQSSVVHRDELVGRVREELNLDLEALSEEQESDDQEIGAVEEEIADLRQKIERLGHVNLDAIDELAELEERESFLSSQYQDLQDSRKQLEALIRKLDAESRERFTKAFEAIRENFRTLFRKLFGGGKADIVLEDPDTPLDCGIEILAKPPGKEFTRITLLSGGEKTMTAIALVMSIFRAQPSPFAFLDEVDAALDEANNARFNSIIQEFLDKSQFIVVTHSKRTMSIADQLYGITMQEPGVSSRVSVKFGEERPGEEHAVA